MGRLRHFIGMKHIMNDIDPELQAILRKRASSMQKEATFFEKVSSEGINHVNDSNIDDMIQKSPIPVLVDFSADAWCRPCQVMAPIYDELSHEFSKKVLFLKINTDHNRRSSEKYRIFSVPTFMLFNAGKVISQRTGASPKAKFKQWIEESIKRVQ